MKMLTFSSRTTKEILRDPLNLAFGIGFPVVLLLLFSAIQANIPVSLFEIQNITPGVVVFGLSFMTLFSATLIAKDRQSALLQRLYTTPLTAADFVFGYTLPVIPIGIAQALVCFVFAFILGLKISVNFIIAILAALPAILLFVSLGLLCGSVFTDKQVGGICGALLTNLTAWLSGAWFDLELVGGAFKKVADALPFAHAVEAERLILNGTYNGVLSHILVVLAYALIITAAAVFAFTHSMKKQ